MENTEQIRETVFNAIISQRETFIEVMYKDLLHEIWIPKIEADSQKKREFLAEIETENIIKLIESDEEQTN